MSRLREILQFTKEEDPAKTLTVSIPSSLVNWVDRIMADTNLGRSAVVKALLQDGLIEYLNSPIVDLIKKLREEASEPDFEGYFELDQIAGFLDEFTPENVPDILDADFVFSTLREKMELNRKLVTG